MNQHASSSPDTMDISVLSWCPCCRRAGYEVVGLDTGYFRACTLGADNTSVPEITKDLRAIEPPDLAGL